MLLIARSSSNRNCCSIASLSAHECAWLFGSCANAKDVAMKVTLVAIEIIRRRTNRRENKGILTPCNADWELRRFTWSQGRWQARWCLSIKNGFRLPGSVATRASKCL
jgi:hypothetical protein